MVNIKFTKTFCYLVAILTVPFIACEKLVEVDPPATSSGNNVVFGSEASSAAVTTGTFAKLYTNNTSIGSLFVYGELLGDNMDLFSTTQPGYLSYYKNAVTPVGLPSAPAYWSQFYTILYNVNAVLENAPLSASFSPAFKERLLGEAYFMRAFCYYYLVNLYGDVPLVLSTVYTETSRLGRAPVADVYKQIVADLLEAQKKLGEDYVDPTLVNTSTERLRPNKFAATALLARTYLHTKEYAKAEAQATAVIDKTTMYDTIPLSQVFLKNSNETIWALQPVRFAENTMEALMFVLTSSGPNTGSRPVYLSNRLMTKFETGDLRLTNWTGTVTVAATGNQYSFARKYKVSVRNSPVSEYPIVLRLAEQYLIRAEARMEQDNYGGAASDLNVIRKRAGLPNTTAADKESFARAILQERRIELFTEWAHRWIDMKRVGKIDEIMPSAATEKGTTWQTEWQLLPVPAEERRSNTNLSQNLGYPQ